MAVEVGTAIAGHNAVRTPVYLDNQATTPMDPRVLDAMMPWFTGKFGNAHSGHRYGWEAEAAVNLARGHIADLIGGKRDDIVFLSGATEANNLAIKGLAATYGARRDHIVTVATEHKCVLEACRRMESNGFAVTYLPVGADGLVDPAAIAAAMTERTLLVSVMAVNNEIGVIAPLAEIGRLCREKGVFFHTDCAQALGKIPLDVEAMGIDLMSLSGHKLYGPKGIGALYVRSASRIRLTPLMDGGGQEKGLRSGTLPVPLCIGFGAACRIAGDEMEAEAARLKLLADGFLEKVLTALPEVRLNGSRHRRIPGNINLTIPGIDGNRLMAELRELALSSGSACSSASDEPSYVLAALGIADRDIRSSLRIGLGRMTTAEEMAFAADVLVRRIVAMRG
jgi:cysteine desulfurase